MNLGDTFVDPQKRNWTIEAELGQGTWGRTFQVRGSGGECAVLKIALTAADFPSDTPVSDELLRACRDAAREQARLLEGGSHGFLPKLLGTLTLSSGTPALLISHYGHNLEAAIASGKALSEIVALIETLATQLAKAGFVHGNLRPENLLINDRGGLVVTDPLTEATAGVRARLEALVDGRTRWRPPEAEGQPPGATFDTWALCQLLYQAALHRDASADARPTRAGLDRIEIATLKDRALARLTIEATNPRFRSRMADRLGAILHRGLSTEYQPSPPYRFVDCKALAERLAEVSAMVDPRVEDVGRLLPAAHAVSGVHRGDGPVEFTVSVGCSAGVTNHEDVVCGLKLVDLDDANRRVPVPEAQYEVERHRSGRLRFAFTLPDVPPGRYRLKCAFSVRESAIEPEVASGEFEVRPPPGYVPPAQTAPSAAPIVMGRIGHKEPEIHAVGIPTAGVATSPPASFASDPAARPSQFPTATGPSTAGVSSTHASDPGAEIIDGLFPRPIAPPTDQPEWSPEPVEARAAPMPVVESEVRETPVIHMPLPAAVGAGAMDMPQASASIAGTPGLSAVPAIHMPAGSLGAPPAPAAPAPANPIREWFAETPDLFKEGALLPGLEEDGEELPSWKGPGLVDRIKALPVVDLATDWIARDSYNAFLAATTCCFLLLLIVMAVMNAL